MVKKHFSKERRKKNEIFKKKNQIEVVCISAWFLKWTGRVLGSSEGIGIF